MGPARAPQKAADVKAERSRTAAPLPGPASPGRVFASVTLCARGGPEPPAPAPAGAAVWAARPLGGYQPCLSSRLGDQKLDVYSLLGPVHSVPSKSRVPSGWLVLQNAVAGDRAPGARWKAGKRGRAGAARLAAPEAGLAAAGACWGPGSGRPSSPAPATSAVRARGGCARGTREPTVSSGGPCCAGRLSLPGPSEVPVNVSPPRRSRPCSPAPSPRTSRTARTTRPR